MEVQQQQNYFDSFDRQQPSNSDSFNVRQAQQQQPSAPQTQQRTWGSWLRQPWQRRRNNRYYRQGYSDNSFPYNNNRQVVPEQHQHEQQQEQQQQHDEDQQPQNVRSRLLSRFSNVRSYVGDQFNRLRSGFSALRSSLGGDARRQIGTLEGNLQTLASEAERQGFGMRDLTRSNINTAMNTEQVRNLLSRVRDAATQAQPLISTVAASAADNAVQSLQSLSAAVNDPQNQEAVGQVVGCIGNVLLSFLVFLGSNNNNDGGTRRRIKRGRGKSTTPKRKPRRRRNRTARAAAAGARKKRKTRRRAQVK